MENKSRQKTNKQKESKNTHQEGHFTKTNRSNRVNTGKETTRHTTNMQGLSAAPSLTQEVRQSLEKQTAEHRKSFSTAEISKSGVMERAQE